MNFFINIKNCLGFLAIIATFLCAIFLSILPIPVWMKHLWPLWTLLVLIFWAVYLPQVVSPWLVWFMGLFDDIVLGSLLGEHALIYVCVYFLSLLLSQQIRGFSLLIQILSIGAILLIYQICMIIVQHVTFQHYSLFIFPLFTSLILWPSLFFILRSIAMRFYIQYM